MPKYLVDAGFIDCWSHAKVTVQARTVEEACEKAIAKIDEGEVETDRYTHDPGATFVESVIQLDRVGRPIGDFKVPREFTERGEILNIQDAKKKLVDALKLAERTIQGTLDSRGYKHGQDVSEWSAEVKAELAALVPIRTALLDAERKP